MRGDVDSNYAVKKRAENGTKFAKIGIPSEDGVELYPETAIDCLANSLPLWSAHLF